MIMYASIRKTCPDFCLSWYSLYLPSSVDFSFFLQGVKELNKNTLNPDLCRRKEVGCLRFCRRKEVGAAYVFCTMQTKVFSHLASSDWFVLEVGPRTFIRH